MTSKATRPARGDLATMVLLAGGTAAAVTEGLRGGRAVGAAHVPWASVLAFWGMAGLTLTVVLPVVLLVAGVVRRPEVRAFACGVRSALGNGDRLRGSLAAIASVAGIAYAVPLSARLTRWLFARSGANVAAPAGVLVALALVASACVLGVVIGSVVASRIARTPWLRRHSESAVARGLGAVLVVSLVIAMANALAADAHALTLDVAILASASLLVPRIGEAVSRWAARRSVAVAVTSAVVCCAGAPLATMSLPNEAQLAVFHHAPFAAAVMGTLQVAYARIAPPRLAPRAPVLDARGDERPTRADAILAESPDEPRRDIVLVHLDTVRPDHVGFAGYARATTPSLDRFRAEATWFERAYTTQPSTLVAIGSVFTGIQAAALPNRRGPGPDLTLLPSSMTISERLDALGYDVIGLTMPYVFEHMHGADRGFRVWQPSYPAADAEQHRDSGAAVTTDRALAFLEERSRSPRPMFMFVHYECAHGPYVRHPSFDFGESLTDRYDGAIAYCDSEVGRLLAALSVEGDRTAVLIYSDHGELLGEHGYSAHGATLLEADVRVLLLARIPDARLATVRTPVSLADLAPTVLALAGESDPTAGPAWNLLPLTHATETDRLDRPIFLHRVAQRGPYHVQAHGVVVADTKYVHTDPDLEELYRLDIDPTEHTNLLSSRFGERPDDVRALRAPLAALIDDWRRQQIQRVD